VTLRLGVLDRLPYGEAPSTVAAAVCLPIVGKTLNYTLSLSRVLDSGSHGRLSSSLSDAAEGLHSAVMSRKAFVREVLCATLNGKERSQWLLPDGSCAAALWIQGTVVVPEDQTGFLTLDDGYENCAV
jgi:hypothetical protein